MTKQGTKNVWIAGVEFPGPRPQGFLVHTGDRWEFAQVWHDNVMLGATKATAVRKLRKAGWTPLQEN